MKMNECNFCEKQEKEFLKILEKYCEESGRMARKARISLYTIYGMVAFNLSLLICNLFYFYIF
jgi:hypothetical protein